MMTNPNTVPMEIVEAIRIVSDAAVLPNLGMQATREWLVKFIGLASAIRWWMDHSALPTTAEEATMNFLRQAVRDDDLYDPIYRIWLAVLSTVSIDRTLTPDERKQAVRPLAAAAEQYGVDPLAVLSVIESIASMVELIREQ